MQNPRYEEIFDFLKAVDTAFPVPLSEKQSLEALAHKFCEKATVCYEKRQGKIVCLVAGYTKEITDNMAYISVVATLPDVRGKGYAQRLVRQFLEICEGENIAAVHLYTDKSNAAAIALYKKLGFVFYTADNEPRPEDVHLIYYINGEKR